MDGYWDLEECLNKTPFTRYNRLSNRLYNWFDNRLYRVNKHPTGCQTGCQMGLTTVLNEQLFVQPVVKPSCTTGLTNTVWQPVECLYTRYSRLSRRLSNGFDNRFDNRVKRTAVHSTGCQTGLYNQFDKHGLTTGWMFVYTIQPVLKPFDNRFDNRLYRVNGALESPFPTTCLLYLKWSYLAKQCMALC